MEFVASLVPGVGAGGLAILLAVVAIRQYFFGRELERQSKEQDNMTEQFRYLDNKLDAIIGWAITTGQGDTDWLKRTIKQ